MTDDEKVAQRYRELGVEEPPRALDDAILAAVRREAAAGPAALSVRSSRQRWYAPLATAAVLVLAVAVTLNMQLEQPDIVSPVPQAASQRADQPAAKKPEKEMPAMKQVAPMRRKDAGQAAPAASPAPAAPAAREPQPFAADRAAATAGSPGSASSRPDDSRGAESSASGALARQMEERTSRDAEAAARAPQMGAIQAQAKRAENAERARRAEPEAAANSSVAPPPAPAPAKPATAPPVAAVDLARPAPSPVPAAKPMPLGGRPAELTPERELERIADLRRQERHEEADKALAEFRKRHPDHKIPGAVLERVERR